LHRNGRKQAQTGLNRTGRKVTQAVESKQKANEINAWRLCVAPMLDWKDARKKPKRDNRLGL
jgi:hypothetical protein